MSEDLSLSLLPSHICLNHEGRLRLRYSYILCHTSGQGLLIWRKSTCTVCIWSSSESYCFRRPLLTPGAMWIIFMMDACIYFGLQTRHLLPVQYLGEPEYFLNISLIVFVRKKIHLGWLEGE